MKRILFALPLLLAAGSTLAAAPQRGIVLQAQPDPLAPRPLVAQPQVPRSAALQPAPLPNRDIENIPGPRSNTEATVRPTLFTRSDTYRGDGFAKNDSAAIEQDKRVKPGVGFNLRMPFSQK